MPRWVGEQGVNREPHEFPERARSLDMERESGLEGAAFWAAEICIPWVR